ncbi:hypothetical protein EU527_19590 [Candidatus Thorarchaeota archaeon]|nr:MAG: hypothetical protein EU527_19590 [Candidatus Thorarchaeota archaeon]
MKADKKQRAAFILIFTFLVFGSGTRVAAETVIGPYEITQTISPFTEMLPGVYVGWQWWNETGDDYSIIVEPGYYSGIEDIGEGGFRYIAEYYVEDIYGTGYTITEDSYSNWTNSWSFSNLLVVVLLDPDASYISWMNRQGDIKDIWSVFWWPESGALSGDEVFIYSSFYYSESNSSSYYLAEYSWEDEFGSPVDANSIIPNLREEYFWASFMNGTYEYDYDWNYCGFGYDVNEMFRTDDTEQWMQHYFSGLSVFNDTNGNGQMDIVYSEVSYDFDEDGYIDWVNYEMNRTASELVYDFYADNAKIGDIGLPHINSDGQIEWSAEVTDITGDLMTFQPYNLWYCEVLPVEYMTEEPESLPINIDSLELTFRFEATDEAAVIKIDQYVGDFTDPITGLVPFELDGLGLTLNYWSSFSSYTVTGEIYAGQDVTTFYTEDVTWSEPYTVTGGEEYTEPGIAPTTMTEWASAPSGALESEAIPDGFLRFSEETALRSTVEFGGTYVLGSDGLTYDVGTAVMPMYFYSYGYDTATPAAELAYSLDSWWGQTYYYSSCYAKWDGYSITHDPIFSVFPIKSPSAASAFITGLVNASIIIGVFGVVALSVVFVRINAERKH